MHFGILSFLLHQGITWPFIFREPSLYRKKPLFSCHSIRPPQLRRDHCVSSRTIRKRAMVSVTWIHQSQKNLKMSESWYFPMLMASQDWRPHYKRYAAQVPRVIPRSVVHKKTYVRGIKVSLNPLQLEAADRRLLHLNTGLLALFEAASCVNVDWWPPPISFAACYTSAEGVNVHLASSN